jgi:hypothetical protein
MDQTLGMGSKTLTVEKDQYIAGDNRIDLTLSPEEAKQLPQAQTQ